MDGTREVNLIDTPQKHQSAQILSDQLEESSRVAAAHSSAIS